MAFRGDLKVAKEKEEKSLIVPAHFQSQKMVTEQLYRGETQGLRNLYQYVQNVSPSLSLSVSKHKLPWLHIYIEELRWNKNCVCFRVLSCLGMFCEEMASGHQDSLTLRHCNMLFRKQHIQHRKPQKVEKNAQCTSRFWGLKTTFNAGFFHLPTM